jgi:hypothetical protein
VFWAQSVPVNTNTIRNAAIFFMDYYILLK